MPARRASATSRFIDAGGPCRSPRHPGGADIAPAPSVSRGQDLERSADPGPATLRELGERLEHHIRSEERVLFPMIEEALPVDELERLGAAFARAEAGGE